MAQLRFSSKKVNNQVFWDEFARHQRDGYLGNPDGEDGYGYLRVSSDGQTNEERNGVPRQIENLHNAALRDGVRISWEMIYGDDESGYITDRPALQELLTESNRNKKGDHMVFESISRMSREWEWQQGWLLYQFEGLRKMTVHFFDEAGSPLERMFKGYVAGESMKIQRKLMEDGRNRKARNGFVPYGRPAFGFYAAAKEGYDPAKIREFCTWKAKWDGDPAGKNGCTQFGEAKIVKEIFELLAFDGLSTYSVARLLEEKYGPPKNYKHWFPIFISDIVKNHAYYGKFTYNRWDLKKVETLSDDGKVTRKATRRERPMSEWKFVDVEAIVSKELWDLANRALVQNKKTSPRNKKIKNYLLSGILKCAHCGFAWIADSHTIKATTVKPSFVRCYYRCAASKKSSLIYSEVECPTTGLIRAEVLDAVVWDNVRDLIFHPEVLLALVDRQAESDTNQQVQSQIDFIQNQIQRRKLTDVKDRELYDNGFMKVTEYGPKHKEMAAQIGRWEASIEDLKKKLMTQADVEQKKARIIANSNNAKRYEHLGREIPFDLKLNLIKMFVDVVYIDEPKNEVRIVGEIGDITRSLEEYAVADGRLGLQADKVVNGSLTRASLPPS